MENSPLTDRAKVTVNAFGQNDLCDGVSGSGKSTLINETLYPILNAYYLMGKKSQ
jgi:excinuclease UvrABC ATPase subunit